MTIEVLLMHQNKNKRKTKQQLLLTT